MPQKKKLSKAEAFTKVKSYCAYQERSHREVREKLYGFGLFKSEVEELITNLIQENYLNEERFAIQYAGGKFRTRGWGRIKIRYELQQKGISSYCIKKALGSIDEADYLTVLNKNAATKAEQLSTESPLNRRAKLQSYLLQKGYESQLVTAAIKELIPS